MTFLTGLFIDQIIPAILNFFDNILSFLFTYFWLPDLFPSATTAIQSAGTTITPILISINSVFPLYTLFTMLGYIFLIEVAVLFFKVALIVIRLIRG